jgi:hypothetical protein
MVSGFPEQAVVKRGMPDTDAYPNGKFEIMRGVRIGEGDSIEGLA